jgi:hypothetical protein
VVRLVQAVLAVQQQLPVLMAAQQQVPVEQPLLLVELVAQVVLVVR